MRTVHVTPPLPPDDLERLRARWDALCIRVGAFASSADADLTFEMIHGLYESPPRAYHNLGHVDQCLRAFDSVRRLADDADAVEMALVLHDCVFAATREDNEQQSAFVAQAISGLIGAPADFVRRVHEHIMATRHDERPLTGDDALTADVDLSILAADADEYATYRAAIRDEFGFADGDLFSRGRLAFVSRQLARKHIFSTPYFRSELERAARANLTRERDDLEDRLHTQPPHFRKTD